MQDSPPRSAARMRARASPAVEDGSRQRAGRSATRRRWTSLGSAGDTGPGRCRHPAPARPPRRARAQRTAMSNGTAVVSAARVPILAAAVRPRRRRRPDPARAGPWCPGAGSRPPECRCGERSRRHAPVARGSPPGPRRIAPPAGSSSAARTANRCMWSSLSSTVRMTCTTTLSDTASRSTRPGTRWIPSRMSGVPSRTARSIVALTPTRTCCAWRSNSAWAVAPLRGWS